MIANWSTALKFRDFRVLWLSTACNSIGFGMDQVVLGWLVFELTSSPFMVGVALALKMAPLFLLGITSGIIADRVDRRLLLQVVTLIAGVLMVSMGTLLQSGIDNIWIILMLSTLSGATFAFILTLRQSYTYDLVGPANSLNGLSMLQIASVSGAILGSLSSGFLIDAYGAGLQFIIVGLTYFASFGLLFGTSSKGSFVNNSKQKTTGFTGYIGLLRQYPTLIVLMVLASITEIFGFSHMSLIAVYAKDVIDVGPIGLGYITALRQLGGVIGLILLASLGNFQRKGLLMFIITILFGFGQIAVYGLEGAVSYALMLFFLNACAMSVDTIYKTLMQLNVPNHQRGTAMGSWVLSIGTGPVGHLGVGFIATTYSAPMAMLINGIILASAGIGSCFALPKIRKLP